MAANAPVQPAVPSWGPPLSRVAGATAVAMGAVLVGLAVPPALEAIFSNSDAGIWSGVLLVLAAGAPTAIRLRRHPLDPPALYAISTMVLLGLTSLAWLGEPIKPGPGLNQADVAEALRLVAVGLALFGVGAWLVSPRADNASNGAHGDFSAPSSAALLTTFGVSLVGIVIAFALGTYSYISDPAAVARGASFNQILDVVGIIGNFVVIATAVSYYATSEPRLLRLLVLFATMQMTIGFVGGSKGPALLPLLFVLGAYVLARRRLPLMPIALVTFFFFIVVIPTNLSYREGVRVQSLAPGEALQAAVGAPLELELTAIAENARDYVTTRFRSIDSVALIIDQTPSTFPYARGENYALLPAIAVIPRALWPDKPELDATAEFTQTYAQRPAKIRSSTQLTQIGDLYRNFGYIGVFVGMLGVGLLVGGANRAFQRYRSPRADALLIYTALTVIIYTDAYIPGLLATASKTLPAMALTAWLLLPGPSSPPGYLRLLRRSRPAG
jgi:hypothetical protein